MRDAPDLVSVVVPSFNAGPWLAAQLDALAGQDYRGELEVIVADNGSRDSSCRAALEVTRGQLDLRVIDASSRRGPGHARNMGASCARGDFLAFCDADDVASASWLSELVKSALDADLVGGRIEGRSLNHTSSGGYDISPETPHLDFLPAANGGNLGIWTEVFTALEGFDENSRTGEDVELVWRAQLSGYAYRASPAVVHKRFPSGLHRAARQFFGYGFGDAWLYTRFAEAGMPRRTRTDTTRLWLALANGFSAEPPEIRRVQWVRTLAHCAGRLVGSARHRVLFT